MYMVVRKIFCNGNGSSPFSAQEAISPIIMKIWQEEPLIKFEISPKAEPW
jgi:hypothetical protein